MSSQEEGRKSLIQNPYTRVGLVLGGILTALSMSGTSLFHSLDDTDENRVEKKADHAEAKSEKTYELLKQKVEFEAQKTTYLYEENKHLRQEMRDLRMSLRQVLLGNKDAVPLVAEEEALPVAIRAPASYGFGMGGGGGGGGGSSLPESLFEAVECESENLVEDPLAEFLEEPAEELLDVPQKRFDVQMQEHLVLPDNLNDVLK